MLSDAELEVIADNLARLQLPRVTHLKVAVAVIGPAHDAGSPARRQGVTQKAASGRRRPAARFVLEGKTFPARAGIAREIAGRTGRKVDTVLARLRYCHDDAEACCVTSRRGRRRARRASCPRPSPRAQPSPRPPLRTGAVTIFPPFPADGQARSPSSGKSVDMPHQT